MSTSGTPNINEYALSRQLRDLVRHLRIFRKITNIEAMSIYRIMALPRRISDLKELGVEIVKTRRINPVTGQRFVEYSLPANQKMISPIRAYAE